MAPHIHIHMHIHTHKYLCIYIYVDMCVYTYVYIERERERERARGFFEQSPKTQGCNSAMELELATAAGASRRTSGGSSVARQLSCFSHGTVARLWGVGLGLRVHQDTQKTLRITI